MQCQVPHSFMFSVLAQQAYFFISMGFHTVLHCFSRRTTLLLAIMTTMRLKIKTYLDKIGVQQIQVHRILAAARSKRIAYSPSQIAYYPSYHQPDHHTIYNTITCILTTFFRHNLTYIASRNIKLGYYVIFLNNYDNNSY